MSDVIGVLVLIGALLGFLWGAMFLSIVLMWLMERDWSAWMRKFWSLLFWPLSWYDRRGGT